MSYCDTAVSLSWDLLESVFSIDIFDLFMQNCWCRWWPDSSHFYYIMHKSRLNKLIHNMQFALISLTMEIIGKKCKVVLNLETNMTDLWSINFSSCLCSHLQFKFHYSHCSWPHASWGAKYAHHYVTLKYHMKTASTFWWKVISQPFAFSCNFGSSIKFVLPPKWHMGHAINLVYWSSVSCTSTAIIHCQF